MCHGITRIIRAAPIRRGFLFLQYYKLQMFKLEHIGMFTLTKLLNNDFSYWKYHQSKDSVPEDDLYKFQG